jgi:hypothetical protein
MIGVRFPGPLRSLSFFEQPVVDQDVAGDFSPRSRDLPGQLLDALSGSCGVRVASLIQLE